MLKAAFDAFEDSDKRSVKFYEAGMHEDEILRWLFKRDAMLVGGKKAYGWFLDGEPVEFTRQLTPKGKNALLSLNEVNLNVGNFKKSIESAARTRWITRNCDREITISSRKQIYAYAINVTI